MRKTTVEKDDSSLFEEKEQTAFSKIAYHRAGIFIFLGALFLVFIGLVLPKPWQQTIHKYGLELFSPVIWIWDKTVKTIDDYTSSLKTLDQVQLELKELKAKNAQLAMENSYLTHLRQENERLKEMLSFRHASRYRLLACRVISRDPTNWWNDLLIDVGWADDNELYSDLPVVTPRGVVGKTGIVARHTTEVILLTNENCKISAMTEVSKDQGLVVGAGTNGENKPYSRMIYLPRNSQVGVGERVLTSGLGGVFPPGLYIGSVIQLEPLDASHNFGLYREVILDTGVDLTQLNELFVILVGKRE
ncbi:rod shape-determining protein MreC [Methylacidiphilum kamchatkense Kam1]|uniref:Cell shape-determining protein MreC n=1 Tax=Methylacidiphilum kamchatkense Kam1 TaxID=1202785 RepID=A0A0C1RM34_9BACT|nr:rod shape-determining protein MreC [Methylacidiphilum kamchatkense]KIE59122.1 rod shape-determining protein MreC [Methylacidiphilum kamchatkense Kam1]QDQ42958.1 rod shape-determining protein MreC [Methylacidiphilum kamchatkense Kam1]